jgi:hypothetical protein
MTGLDLLVNSISSRPFLFVDMVNKPGLCVDVLLPYRAGLIADYFTVEGDSV